jgi:hypothetical protein
MLEDLLDDTDGARFWRATDQILARNVAVHVLADSDPRSDALLTAARTSALVTDAHLLRVLDAAHEDGMVYVVNEWGSGVTLDRLLAEGPLSPRRAAWVVKEVAEAIATAHRNGVAHGRLLPETVMISEAGSVKLVGFVVDAVLRGRHQHLVTGGDAVGAHEADVLNLAGLLYAALTGRWPGTQGSSLPVAPSDHGHPLRPRQVRAGVPRPLDAICDRVLNAEAHQNHMPIETAHEIYAALSDYIGDPAGSAQLGVEATTIVEHELPGDDLGDATQIYRPGGLTSSGDGSTSGTNRSSGPAETDAETDTGELDATGWMPAPTGATSHHPPAAPAPAAVDPESTQAAGPMFYDEDTGVGWASPVRSRGLRQGEAEDRGAGQGNQPPDLPPVPERPLFADGRPAGPAADRDEPDSTGHPGRSGRADSGSFLGGFTGLGGGSGDETAGGAGRGASTRSTGAGNGPVPADWGPADADESSRGEHWRDWEEGDDTGQSWLKLAAAIAGIVVLVVGIIFAFNLGRGKPSDSSTGSGPPSASASSSAPATHPVRVSRVTDFDPEGDPPEENPNLTSLAVDGKPGTAWQTQTYYNNPRLGGLKSGVGLLVDLGSKQKIGSVRLTLLGEGTSLQLLAAPDAVSAPSGTDGLRKVASADDAGTRVSLSLRTPVTTRWFVVWLTSLPPAGGGGYQGQVAEISVRS